MLLEFSCSNHKSIKDKVLFSTLASSDTSFLERTKSVEGFRVLRSAVIYGANGSGKSNFVDAISFVKGMVVNSINHQPGQGVKQTPHKTTGFDSESSYRIQFITKGVRYAFGFTLRKMLVVNEYLFFFPNGKQTKIFEREGESFTTGRSFRNKLTRCKDVLKSNRLLLSCAANFSSVKEIEDAYRFFLDDLVIYGDSIQDNWMQYSLNQMANDENTKKAVVKLMQSLGLGLMDVLIRIDEAKLDLSAIPPFLSDEFKNQLVQGTVNAITAKVKYPGFETDLFVEESAGIQKLFGFLCPLIDIIYNEKVLICDELESGLHEALVYEILKTFFATNAEKFAQIVFTTHDTSLLNLDLFRRDQIWFTEMKNEDRATDLYSLAEIRNVRKDENYAKGYINGKYGAIPMLNLSFADTASNER